jgi:hypothetical protein
MTGFRISVNGEPFCESHDLTVFTMVVEDTGLSGEQRVMLHARAGEGPLQWLAANLHAGDAVRIEVVDIAVADAANETQRACSFCGGDIHELNSLIEGPGAAICDGCSTSFSEAVRNRASLPAGAAIHSETALTCGFCGQGHEDVPALIVRNGAAICPECLRSCEDMLRDSAGQRR